MPYRVIEEIVKVVSLKEVLSGFFCAVALAIPFGLLIGWSTEVRAYFNPVIQIPSGPPDCMDAVCDRLVRDRDKINPVHYYHGSILPYPH